jgi:Bacterial PH domain
VSTWIRPFEELDLPKGERLLWQGRPRARALAVRVFHMRLVVAYFSLLFAARVAIGALEHQPWLASVAVASRLAVPLAIVMVLLGGLAVLYSRTTLYSVTDRRVLLQFGAVLPMTLTIPFRQVASAAVKAYADGSGDIPIAVTGEERLKFLLLWPHVRPWRLKHVEPMIRGVPQVREVSNLLAGALTAASPRAPESAVAAIPTPRQAEPTPAIATAA